MSCVCDSTPRAALSTRIIFVTSLPAVVRSNRRATPTTRVLTIDLMGHPFEFRAGQWARVGLTADAGSPFSIASEPQADALQFLIREERSGLALTEARRGTPVQVDGPHGRFCLAADFLEAEDALFIAGGTGISPIRSMLRDALRHAKRPRCTLVYSARNSDEFAFLAEFREAARGGLLTLSLSATRHAHSRWKGLSGRLGAAILESVVRERKAPQCYLCGPEGFVVDVKAALEQLGVTRIRTEEQ